MALTARWEDLDGQPATPPDFGEVPPGGSKTIERRLRNTGTVPFLVRVTPKVTPGQALAGWTQFSFGGVAVPIGTTHDSPTVAPGDALEVTYSTTVPGDAPPGLPIASVIVICVPVPTP